MRLLDAPIVNNFTMNTRRARLTQIREVCLAALILTGFGWFGLSTSVAADPGDSSRRPGTVTLLRLLEEMSNPASLARWRPIGTVSRAPVGIGSARRSGSDRETGRQQARFDRGSRVSRRE